MLASSTKSRISEFLITSGRSLINIMNSNGPRCEFWGTPEWISNVAGIQPLIFTCAKRPDKYGLIHFKMLPFIPYFSNFLNNSSWFTGSNALKKSLKIASTCPYWENDSKMYSLNEAKFASVNRLVKNPPVQSNLEDAKVLTTFQL